MVLLASVYSLVEVPAHVMSCSSDKPITKRAATQTNNLANKISKQVEV